MIEVKVTGKEYSVGIELRTVEFISQHKSHIQRIIAESLTNTIKQLILAHSTELEDIIHQTIRMEETQELIRQVIKHNIEGQLKRLENL